MAFSFGKSQSAALQSYGNDRASFTASRVAIEPIAKDDPLQPLRAMADRVGKEVEKFAERVDKWHAHGNDSEQAKYQSTLRMVGSFKSIADSTVQELRQQHEAENRGALQKSMRRRIRNMADEERPGQGGGNALLPQSIMPSIESSAPTSEEVHGLRQWEAEAATWDLLRVIIEHYHPEPGTDVAAEKEADLAAVGGVYRYSPNIDIWNRFLLEDDQAKEKELVLRWLERTAKNSESDIESITQQLETESGKDTNTWTSGWLDTRTKIKQLKRFLTNMDGPVRVGPNVADFKTRDQTQELVTQLDPDAPGRQKRALEKPDEYYERALWLACYEMLRRGVPWKEISDWCKDRSEGWRGISLGAAGESHPDGVPNIAGPTVGYLFRRTCYYAARGSRTQYESAVYGLLSGDVKTVESVCRSWDDHLYAHYNALLLSRFDDYLLRNYPTRLSQTVQKFSFRDAAGKLGNWESSSANVIDLLKQHKATAALAHLPIKLIQGCLISRTVDDLVQKVGEAVAVMLRKDDSNTTLILDPASEVASNSPTIYSQTGTAEKHYQLLATDPNGLRILVHMIIALRQGSGLLSINKAERTALDNVIVTYIEVLRTTRKIELIPLYAAQLDEDRRYHCLARILPDITNEEEQQTFIFLMEQYGIDPVRVVTENYLLVTNSIIKAKRTEPISRFDVLEPTGEQDYLWPGKRVKRKFSRAEITQNDEAVLESLRWHVHLEKDIEQSFSVLHTGLIYFLRMGRIGAATQLVTELSFDRLSAIKTEALCGYSFDILSPGAEQQDQEQIRSLTHKFMSASGRPSFRMPSFPSASEHEDIVYKLQAHSQIYLSLQQLVRLIAFFGEWRDAEEELLEIRSQDPTAKMSTHTKGLKELFDNIQITIDPILDSFLEHLTPPESEADVLSIKTTYIPEVILAYISVVQAFAYFTNRDVVTKAMNIATVVADSEREWLQKVFLRSGRMTELVDMLALVGRAMLRMGEHDDEKRSRVGKKAGRRGETIRIWDVNVRN